MSLENCCSVTCSGGSSAPWQSRQVFCPWAETVPDDSNTTSRRNNARQNPLFRQISIDRQRDDIAQREHCCTHDDLPAASTASLIEERKQHPEKSSNTE